MKDLINFNREGMSLEEFKEYFYRKLRLNTLAFNKGEFDELLESLYSKDDSSYKEYIEAMKMMYYGFVRRNATLINKYINNYSASELELAHKMISYQDHVVERNMVGICISQAKNYKKNVLTSTKQILQDIKSGNENSIVRKAQEDFKQRFVDSLTNDDLVNLFNSLYNQIEEKIMIKLNDQLNSVDGVVKAYYSQQHDEHKVNAIRISKKLRK